MTCPSCNAAVLEIDVRCAACGTALGASGAHRMVGSLVLGQYEVVDVLGQGGMSVVYKGRHKLTEQEVALKILPPELAAHSQVKSRFLDEAKALATLDHANIVHLYNFGQENGCFVLAMQLVQGQTWERKILEAKQLDWQVSVRIAIDVLRALEYAHGRGVVHRDMKPSNVLVRADDGAATVMDFGIAKMTTSTKLTATGQTMGTVRYMSPEQVRGQDVDARTDIYSLGATLFESLTGDTPFDGNTHFEIMTKHLSEAPPRPSARGVELPAMVEEAVMRSLAKRAEDRWDTARDMRKSLEAALRDADLGLIETQRVSRDQVPVVTPRSIPAGASSPRAVSASTELADTLEPPMARAVPRRSATPWIAAALVFTVILGGGGGAYWWLRMRPAAPHVRGPIPDFTGDGRVPDKQLFEAYTASLIAIDRQLAADGLVGSLTRPIDQIVAVSQAGMCNEKYYEAGALKDTCGTATMVLARVTEPSTMLVLDDPAALQRAMDEGLADAVCVFHAFTPKMPYVPKTPGGPGLTDEICAATGRLANGSGVH